MSRRQALGTLTNQTQNGAHSNAQAAQNLPLKQSASTSSFKGVLAAQACAKFNDENEPPIAPAKSTVSKQSGIDFTIFQEEFSEFKQKLAQKEEPIIVKEIVKVTERIDCEEEEEDGEDNDEDYEDVEDSEEDDSEEDTDEDESDEDDDEDNEKDGEFEDEFQDISRLNLGGLIEDSKASSEKSDIMNVVMNESANTSSSSPMVLDDTIKFQSKLSYSNEDEEEECQEEDGLEKYEDTDEATKKRVEHEERENVLKNCMEYKEDILTYMRHLEKENKPKANYMKKQSDITASMRSILIDWLVEVSEEYRLQSETLYLAVNYTDRFLSQMSVLRGKLQLVGTASMYIAAKYEEITPPDVSEFVFITDDTYTKKQVLRMEHLLLKILDFKMSSPTISWFLMHFLRFIKLNTSLNSTANKHMFNRITNLSRYLCELTLIDADTFLAYLPSQIAASAIYLSFYTLGRSWTKQVAETIGYNHDLSELRSCIIDMHKAMQQAPNHPQQAIQEKYKQAKYECASLIDPPKTLAAHLYNSATQMQ